MTDQTTSSYKQFVISIFSQYSAQLGAIMLSSLLAISTGILNKVTSTVMTAISGSSASSGTILYLNNLTSNQKIWQQLVGDGIRMIQPNSTETTWSNFYISFANIYNLINSFDPFIFATTGRNDAFVWSNANLGAIKNLLLILSSSSLPSTGFFSYDGSQYYFLLPDGVDYGWLSFNTGTSYLAKVNGNNELNLIIEGATCKVLEAVQTAFISNGIYSERPMSNLYTFNFAAPLTVSTLNPKISAPNMLSFSYFNQFLGLTMTVYSVLDLNKVMVTFKDANGKGISITKGGSISFS